VPVRTNALAAAVLQVGRDTQDVTVPDQTLGQFYFAVAVVVLGAAASLMLWYRTDFSGLPDDQQDAKGDLRQQRQARSPVSLRIPATADVAEYWPRLSGLIDAAEAGFEGSKGRVDGPPSSFDALAEARDEITRAWDPLLSRLPKRARQAIELGVLLAVFGAIAVSTSAVVATLEGGDGMPTLPEVLDAAVSLTQSVVSFGADVLTAFPFLDVLWAFAFAYSIMAVEWVYQHWYVTATVVILGGATLAVLESRADGTDRRALYDRRHTTLVVVGSMLLVWLTGTVPAAIMAAFVAAGDLPPVVATVGAAVGFVFALGVAFMLALGAVGGLLQDVFLAAGAGVRFERLASIRPATICRRLLRWAVGYPVGTPSLPQPAAEGREADWSLVGSIIVRRILHVANGVLVVVLAAYVVVSVVDGRLMRVLGALASASSDTQLAVALVVAVPVVVLALQARAAWPDIRTALAESFARQRVRIAVLGRGVPTVGVVAGAVVGYQLSRSIPIGIVLGISHTREEQRYYALVNGSTGVMWDDRDEFEQFLRETVVDCRDTDRTPSSYGYWHATDAFEHGIVDPEVTVEKIHDRIRKHTVAPLRAANGATKRSEVLAELEQFPEDHREQRWDEWYEKGILSRAGDLLVLEYDPWSEESRRRSS